MIDRLRELRPDYQEVRVSLTKEVGRIYQGLNPPRTAQKSFDFYDEWDRDKLERNALAAVLIACGSLRTYQAIPNRPPFGFLPTEAAGEEAGKLLNTPLVVGNNGNEYDPTQLTERLKALETLQRKTFSFDLRQEIDKLSTSPKEDFNHQALDRLSHLVSKADDQNEAAAETQVFWFLVRGMNTDTQICRYALELSFDLYSKHHQAQPTLSQLVEFAPSIYPVIASLASLNLNTFITVMNQLSSHPSDKFKPDFFEVSPGAKGDFVVKITDLFWQRLAKQEGLHSPEAVTTRCPGLVPYRHSLGQSSSQSTHPNPIKSGFKIYLNSVSKIPTTPKAA